MKNQLLLATRLIPFAVFGAIFAYIATLGVIYTLRILAAANLGVIS